jgi:hypothetical protein
MMMKLTVGSLVVCALCALALWRSRALEVRAVRQLPAVKTVVEPPYTPCSDSCCDDSPSFCRAVLATMPDACSYASTKSRCANSCGGCGIKELKPVNEATDCDDEWTACQRMQQAIGRTFCEVDTYRQKCRSTCGTCDKLCEDSRLHIGVCSQASKDLRKCANTKTRERCPGTCGVCDGKSLAAVLSRVPCRDQPECALSDNDIATDALNRYRACLDIEGSCRFTHARPNRTALCADPNYRDVLCRATCDSCPDGPQEPVALLDDVPSRPRPCSDVDARTCPRKCGVCKARGSRADWDVSDVDRLIPNLDRLRR